MLKKGLKARPHDLDGVVALKPKMIEFHTDVLDLDKELTGKHDIQMALHVPEYDGDTLLDLSASDELSRNKAIWVLEKALNTARRWSANFRGTPKVIVHPGAWSIEPKPVTERHLLYENFFSAIRGLNTNGVDFLVENMPPHPWFWGGQWYCNIFIDPRECRDRCSGKEVGLCLDLCHAFLWCKHTGFDFARYIQIVKPVMAHVHFSDAKGTDGEGLQIGEGELDIKIPLELIGNVQVGWIPEIWQGHKDALAGFKTCWERTEALMAEVFPPEAVEKWRN